MYVDQREIRRMRKAMIVILDGQQGSTGEPG